MMTNTHHMEFTHLHTHSHFSLLDGLGKIDDLIARAKELGMTSLALTDHGNLYGAIEFYKKAKKAGIKPIIGCEMYIAQGAMKEKNPGIDDKRYHLTVLARTNEGYQNLISLVTVAHLEGFYYKPRVDKAALRTYANGLIALSGCLNGEIPRAILAKKRERAQTLIREYQDIFGKENFYLELGAHPNLPEQKIVNDALVELSQITGASVVGVNDIHYAHPDDADAQDILVSVQTGAKIDDENRLTMRTDDFSMKSGEEMAAFFKDIPEAIATTQEIARRCTVEITLGKPLLPTFSVPPEFTVESYLLELCKHGLRQRYGIQHFDVGARPAETAEILSRLEYELAVIKQTGFSSYFLIVQDFVNWAKSQSIIVGPGRGSAAGSLVSYLLNITNVDPIKYNLIFERFLNPERVSMPDIDLDFADTRRDEVLEYVSHKYGRDHVAQIITFGTMAARAAIRDAGRALGYPYAFCDQIAKLIPFQTTLTEALRDISELTTIYEANPEAKKLIDAAKKLEGVARHASVHACGVVISPEPLSHYLPLQYATRRGEKNRDTENTGKAIVTQYEMHAVEDLGLLKMDFLGLRNLSIIERTLTAIRERRGLSLLLDDIPLDDPLTYKLLQEARTTGVFQLESDGMKRYLKELCPTELEDVLSMVALYRPGPMEAIPDFIAAKHRKRKVSYLHPILQPILEKTYGIIVTQDQVLEIARTFAGFTYAEADVLRKAVGKKIKTLLDEQREKFITRSVKNGMTADVAEKVWNFIEPFARYGFNRAHAACYALVGYQTAYLKARYPAEFMASIMTAEGFEIERVAFLVDEARHMDIAVLPPSINKSKKTFTVVSDTEIRFGLGSVKNVGSNVVEAIIAARESGGEFLSVTDFVERVLHKDLNKKSLESLIKCGAMDMIGERNTLIHNLDTILEHSRSHQHAASSGQFSLFTSAPALDHSPIRLKEVPPTPKRERLSWEKELLGLYISEHPLEEYREKMQNKVTPLKDVERTPKHQLVKIGGIISSIKKIITKAGSPMLFVKIEDLTGAIEVLVFPRVLEKNPAVWQEEKIVLVKGKLSSSERDATIKLICDDAIDITASSLV